MVLKSIHNYIHIIIKQRSDADFRHKKANGNNTFTKR